MSLILTRTQNIRENSPNFYKWEDRPSELGALDFFMKDTNTIGGIATKDLQRRAKESLGSTLQTPVIQFDSGVTISSSRSVTIADDFNTSAMVNFTFVTYSWGWTETPSAHWNNEIKMQEDYEFSYKKYLHKFGKTLDTACIAALSAAKTQVFGDPLIYPTTGNVITASLADEFRLFADVGPIMNSNDFYGPLHYIGNPGFRSVINRIGENATYNAVNHAIELQNRELHFTNRITNATDMGASFYAVNEGAAALLYRFEIDALLRTKSRTGHEWDIDTLIGLDIPVSTYYYEGVGDFSADHGAATAANTRTFKKYFGFSVDVCFVTAYNSDPTTIASPILGCQVATS